MNKRWLLILGLAVLLLCYLSWQLPVVQWIEQFRLWILDLGAFGVWVFVIVHVLSMLFLGPALALTLMAGLAYGAWGFPLVVGSSTLGAGIAFLLGRYVARGSVTRWINKDERLRSLNSVISGEGWRVVGLMRLSPVIPYGVQNYLFAVTDVQFLPYMLATFVGVMPATALFVYIGAIGQTLEQAGALQWSLVIGGVVATVVLAVFVSRRARAALSERSTGSGLQNISKR